MKSLENAFVVATPFGDHAYNYVTHASHVHFHPLRSLTLHASNRAMLRSSIALTHGRSFAALQSLSRLRSSSVCMPRCTGDLCMSKPAEPASTTS